jgi:phosphate starvation-inducible protein PhoH
MLYNKSMSHLLVKLSKKLQKILDQDKLKVIEGLTKTSIEVRGDELLLEGVRAIETERLLLYLETHINHSLSIEELKAIYIVYGSLASGHRNQNTKFRLAGLGKSILPKSPAQSAYLELMSKKDIVFASGVAGTGKTHIAAAMGLNSLLLHEVDRLILSRPAVEAGEKLGFLPGDLKDKVDPYLRPLYDELLTWIQPEALERFIAQNKIEIAPLAYMRGRTLRNAWIILDEAQNTSANQMKMFLTRFGLGSKMIITGDDTQIDLPNQVKSGFRDAINRLSDIEEIGFVHFDAKSVIRHPLLSKVIDSYNKQV